LADKKDNKWQEIIKNHLISLITPVVVALIIFFGWDVAVDKYLIPRVEAKLLEDNYLRDEIKKGMFVTTDKESFHKNHVLSAQQLIMLKDDKVASLKSITMIEEKLVSLKKEMSDFEDEKIDPINQKLNEIIDGLSILKANDEGKIKLSVYFHKDASQQGTLVLNRQNPAISSLIKNNDIYKLVSLNNNKEKYRVRVQDLTIDGKKVNEAIASLYIEDHDELFSSSKSSGIGTAFININ